MLSTKLRTNTCNDLNKTFEGKNAKLCGWVHARRDHGGIIFIDLRDRYGVTQVVFYPECKDFEDASTIRREDVIQVEGTVCKRKEGMDNPKLATGEIELKTEILNFLNKSKTPVIEIEDDKPANEDMRLEYRYLDLRRPCMQKNLRLRHDVTMSVRNFFSEKGFLEIETPLLVKPTPEGARDYVVPSRVNPGKSYALPQSPQLYKQILMVSGCDRYFQIAKCLRDEDLRADRQPEFTQIDVEMSFVEQEDVHNIGEQLVKSVFKNVLNIDIPTPFPKITHKESMEKYGCDKPDLRFGLELKDVTDIVKNSDFGVFKDVAENKGIVKCIVAEKNLGRSDIDDLIKFCQENGAKGMAWMRVTDAGLESNIAKYFSADLQKELIHATNAKPNSIMMFIADMKKDKCNFVISRLRNELGKRLGLINEKEFRFCWIVDFPLFEWDEELNDYVAAHHMFTMPKKECIDYLENDKSKVYAQCYDMVLNGVEMASGSVRIHREDIQKRVMLAMNISEDKAQEKFGFLLRAFEFGAPPHAGFAIGLDRFVSMMNGTSDIRDVIAFPKNKNAQCPMDGSPADFEEKALKELHIKLNLPKKDEKKE
jgi:aspartyl-tRNA synthetase